MNMTPARRAVAAALFLAVFAAPSPGPPGSRSTGTWSTASGWRGRTSSRVMSYLSYMTDVLGPRIPGSPAYDKACDWAVKTFTEIGCVNAADRAGRGIRPRLVQRIHLGPYDRAVLHAHPGRPQAVDREHQGEDRREPGHGASSKPGPTWRSTAESSRGPSCSRSPPGRPIPSFKPAASRYTDADLKELEATPIPVKPKEFGEPKGPGPTWEETQAFFQAEEVGVLVEPSSESRADYGTVKVDAYDGQRQERHDAGPEPAHHHGGRTVQPHLPHHGPRRPGDPRDRGPQRDLRARPPGLQRRRRDPGDRQARRAGHARRPSRFLGGRHGRRGRRLRLRRRHGGHAHPQGPRRQAEEDHPGRPLDRRGGGVLRVAGLRRAPFRRHGQGRSRQVGLRRDRRRPGGIRSATPRSSWPSPSTRRSRGISTTTTAPAASGASISRRTSRSGPSSRPGWSRSRTSA